MADDTEQLSLFKPERANREGESQALPIKNEHRDIHSQMCEDIMARQRLGIRRYGVALQPHNGRNALLDAYEECIDLCVYLKQRLMEEGLEPPTPA